MANFQTCMYSIREHWGRTTAPDLLLICRSYYIVTDCSHWRSYYSVVLVHSMLGMIVLWTGSEMHDDSVVTTVVVVKWTHRLSLWGNERQWERCWQNAWVRCWWSQAYRCVWVPSETCHRFCDKPPQLGVRWYVFTGLVSSCEWNSAGATDLYSQSTLCG